jgi:hypothetical protein
MLRNQQNKVLNQTNPANRVMMPFCLSIVLAVSLMAGPGFAKAADKAHPAPTAKTAPASKKETPKPDAPNSSHTADKTKDPVKTKEALKKEFDTSLATAAQTDPMAIMQTPTQFLNKKVTFTATFNRFADIALDYKKAFRDSRDYVTFFVLRPDVTDHTIPMSEMKLFFPRKKSSEVMDLDSGDKIQIIGTEFSTVLDEPWIDVEHIRVVEKTEKKEKKHSPEF